MVCHVRRVSCEIAKERKKEERALLIALELRKI